jgi:hypothetical protein
MGTTKSLGSIGHAVPCRGIGSANGNNQITWAHWARSPLSGNWERQWEQPNHLAHWAHSPLSGNWERQWEQPNHLGSLGTQSPVGELGAPMGTTKLLGPIAQLGARLNGIEEVEGSNPSGSTRKSVRKGAFFLSLVTPGILLNGQWFHLTNPGGLCLRVVEVECLSRGTDDLLRPPGLIAASERALFFFLL